MNQAEYLSSISNIYRGVRATFKPRLSFSSMIRISKISDKKNAKWWLRILERAKLVFAIFCVSFASCPTSRYNCPMNSENLPFLESERSFPVSYISRTIDLEISRKKNQENLASCSYNQRSNGPALPKDWTKDIFYSFILLVDQENPYWYNGSIKPF